MKKFVIIVVAILLHGDIHAESVGEQIIKKLRPIYGELIYFENIENLTYGHLKVSEKILDDKGEEIVTYELKYGKDPLLNKKGKLHIDYNSIPKGWIINPIYTRGYEGGVAFKMKGTELVVSSIVPTNSKMLKNIGEVNGGIEGVNAVMESDLYLVLSGWDFLFKQRKISPKTVVALIHATPESRRSTIFCMLAKENAKSKGALSELLTSVGILLAKDEDKKKSQALFEGVLAERIFSNAYGGGRSNSYSDKVLVALLKIHDKQLKNEFIYKYVKNLLGK